MVILLRGLYGLWFWNTSGFGFGIRGSFGLCCPWKGSVLCFGFWGWGSFWGSLRFCGSVVVGSCVLFSPSEQERLEPFSAPVWRARSCAFVCVCVRVSSPSHLCVCVCVCVLAPASVRSPGSPVQIIPQSIRTPPSDKARKVPPPTPPKPRRPS